MKGPLYIKQVPILYEVSTLYKMFRLYTKSVHFIQNRAKKDPLSADKRPSRGTNLTIWLAPQIWCPLSVIVLYLCCGTLRLSYLRLTACPSMFFWSLYFVRSDVDSSFDFSTFSAYVVYALKIYVGKGIMHAND
jgi:hypothetical protein